MKTGKQVSRCIDWRANTAAQYRRRLRDRAKRRQSRPRKSYWNAHHGIFNVHKFLIARAHRQNLHSIITKPLPTPAEIHFVDVNETQIPLPVLNFLGKSEKLIPTRSLPTWDYMYLQLDSFKTSLHKYFASIDFRKQGVLDPLAGMRRRFFKPVCTWIPKDDCLPWKFDKYISSISGNILNNFNRLKGNETAIKFGARNLSFADHWAISWLKENRSWLLDVPADKNLGSVIICRKTYDTLALESLHKSYVNVTSSHISDLIHDVKRSVQQIINFGKDYDIVNEKLAEYFTC